MPRFVSKWLRESSPTRGLRDLATPNRRRQDGPTVRFLCSDCEQVFSPWESRFAAQVFLPLHRNEGNAFAYDEWGLKFASSVVWRVLTESLEHGHGRLTPEQFRFASASGQAWRAFMLGNARHPGRFEVHAIPLDVVPATVDADVSPFLNRYLLRAADAEVVVGATDVLVYAKLCRILLVGHVVVERQAHWRQSRLSVARGTLGGGRNYYLPIALQKYMNQRAMRGAEALASQSAHQKAKVRAQLEAQLPRFARSEVFRAMRADIEHTGADAFSVTRDVSDSGSVAAGDDPAESDVQQGLHPVRRPRGGHADSKRLTNGRRGSAPIRWADESIFEAVVP